MERREVGEEEKAGGSPRAMRNRAVIVGIGNLILKDEGVGIHVVRELAKRELPPGVKVIDGGTATIDLLPLMYETKRIIVIDAMEGRGQPGTLYRYRAEDLLDTPDMPFSLHQMGFLNVLRLARQLGGHRAYLTVIGVEPGEISFGMELTPEVKNVVPKVIEAVFEELGEL